MHRVYLIAVLVVFGLSANVQAYIDPGTGSLILQALVAAGLGVAFFFRQTAAKLLSVMRPKTRDSDDDHAG